jgi:hypothetical protein
LHYNRLSYITAVWGALLIKLSWEIELRLWYNRNEELHGVKKEEQEKLKNKI